MTKKMIAVMSSLALSAALALSVAAQSTAEKTGSAVGGAAKTTGKAVSKGATKTADATKTAAEKTAGATKDAAKGAKQAVTGKTDAEIQKCLTDKIAASPALKGLGLNVTVTNGEATVTGKAKSAASKGTVTKFAKACGVSAKHLHNNITIETAAKPPAPPKPAPTKK